jgi:hypothetical protein
MEKDTDECVTCSCAAETSGCAEKSESVEMTLTEKNGTEATCSNMVRSDNTRPAAVRSDNTKPTAEITSTDYSQVEMNMALKAWDTPVMQHTCSGDKEINSQDSSSMATSEKTMPGFTENCRVSFLESTERMMQFAEVLYKCKLCMTLPSILTSKDNFLIHMKDVHLKANSADDFDCDECDLKLRTSEDFNLHLRLCHGSCCDVCEEDEVHTSCGDRGAIDMKLSASTCMNDTFPSPQFGSSDICDIDRSYSENEFDPGDTNAVDPSSNMSAAYNCEIRSSKPRMFNFSGGRGTKLRDRKSTPKRRSDMSDKTIDVRNYVCDFGESLYVNVDHSDSDTECCHGNLPVSRSMDILDLEESQNSKKRKMSHIFSPGQTHTIHWGRDTSEFSADDKGEKTDSACKKTKVLDKVVKIPNRNCVEDVSSDSDKVGMKSLSADYEGCHLQHVQGEPRSQALPAIHDMEKYSKYLSRKSFFSMAAHEKLKSSAIYNLISTHMQKDTDGNHSNPEKASEDEVTEHEVSKTENIRCLSSASDRLKSFIKYKNEDLAKRRKFNETDPAALSLKSFVKIEPEDKSDNYPSAFQNNERVSHGRGLPSDNLPKCTATCSSELQQSGDIANVTKNQETLSHNMQFYTKCQEKTAVFSISPTVGVINQDSKHIGKNNSPSLLILPPSATYKCFQCDMYFADCTSYRGHCKRVHDSDNLLYGTPIPKMEQSIAIVKVIQSK